MYAVKRLIFGICAQGGSAAEPSRVRGLSAATLSVRLQWLSHCPGRHVTTQLELTATLEDPTATHTRARREGV